MNIIARYFNWLQEDVPAGEVEHYPEIDENGESSVKGVYIIGDLTGIPLLRLAADSGSKIIKQFSEDDTFQKLRNNNKDNTVYDLLIIGAGPAGVAAGADALKLNYNIKILESAKKFNTILNFPKGKPIYAEPEDYQQKSDIKIENGTKESLIEDLEKQTDTLNLPIDEGVMVHSIYRKEDHLEVITDMDT